MSVFVRLARNQYPDTALDAFTAIPQFNLDNARAMMWLSQLAYETDDESKVNAVLQGLQLTRLGFFHNNALTGLPPHSCCAIVAEGHGATFVAFAGSDPGKFEDWVTDFHAMPTPDGLHSGFAATIENVWSKLGPAIASRTAPAQPLFFTGHSLGGALTILAAARASLPQNPPPIVVYTFGSPRTGDDQFFAEYGALGDSTFRLVDGTDIVPTVPPTLLGGYRHVGQAVQCKTDGLFDGVAPMARDENKPDILESAEQAAIADMGALAALQLIRAIGPSPLDHLAGFLPRMARDHVPMNYFRALSITVPAAIVP